VESGEFLVWNSHSWERSVSQMATEEWKINGNGRILPKIIVRVNIVFRIHSNQVLRCRIDENFKIIVAEEDK
jgi:hypothetical protein